MLIFFGGGVMAEAIWRGLLAQEYDPEQIVVVERRADRCAQIEEKYLLRTVGGLGELTGVAQATLVLAVKPQDAAVALTDVAAHPPRLLVSICAGLTTEYLESRAGGQLPVVRVMPNTPALIGCGATALCAGRFAGAEHLRTVQRMFEAVGVTVVLPEERLMNAVTALSGSGPAYLFALARDLVAGGMAQGLDEATARTLAQQTLLGAAKLWQESGLAPDALIAQVKSKRGTTEAALNTLAEQGWSAAMLNAVAAAARRAQELAEEAR